MWVDQLDFFCSGIQVYLLLSPYLCFISFLYLDLYVLGDDALISWGSFMQTKHLCVLIHIWTKGAPLNRFKPSSKIFYWPFQGGTSFVDLLCFFCLLFAMPLYTYVYMCLVVTCRERGDLLALVCGVLLWVRYFPIGILGQVWFLIVSIPDLCPLTYFEIPPNTKKTNDMVESFHMYFNAHFYTTHPTIFVFWSRGQHTAVLYVLILLYDERKWPLPGKFAYMNDLYICSFDLFAARCIHRHGMIICHILVIFGRTSGLPSAAEA